HEDVGMIELRGDADFLKEALATHHFRHFGAKDLDRDAPIMTQIAREEDRAHRPFADLPSDGIAASQGGGQPNGETRHERRTAACEIMAQATETLGPCKARVWCDVLGDIAAPLWPSARVYLRDQLALSPHAGFLVTSTIGDVAGPLSPRY